MNCFEKFVSIFGKEPEDKVFCPYRVCPLGAHVDHNYGRIAGLAIDKGITIAFSPKTNGIIELVSLQFDIPAQWHVKNIPDTKQNDWADYLRGACFELSQKYNLKIGLKGAVEGTLPIGGLSSSAAVTIAFISALAKVNNLILSDKEIIMTALRAENNYVGVSCGKLDQSCEVYCKKNKLLYLDTLDDSYELIPTSDKMKPYKIAIFFSGLERSLVGSKFNMRVDECKSAAYALKAFSGMEYGKFSETTLRDVPFDVYEEYKDRLPLNWKKRADHWYSENRRVIDGAELWRKGDLEGFGKLIFESGKSSIENYETGSDELKELYEIMLRTDGIYGGRFSGAGFKGCCMSLIDPDYEESVIRKVSEGYIKAFPLLKDKFSVCVCESADGVGRGE